jgi:hypothetical protein
MILSIGTLLDAVATPGDIRCSEAGSPTNPYEMVTAHWEEDFRAHEYDRMRQLERLMERRQN